MKLTKLTDAWVAETHYDRLRWSSENVLEELDVEKLNELRDDLTETIGEVNHWRSRSRSPIRIIRLYMVRNKLTDFRWYVIRELQRKEQHRQHFERLDGIMSPKIRESGSVSPAYGLSTPLKGTPYHVDISASLAPVPIGGAAR